MLAQSGGSPIGDREAALRVRATLQRARRVVESHADALSEAYGNVPVDIADAFGLPEHLGVTHVEAIVRAGVPFQISRYIAPMLRAASDAAGVRPGGYDAVSGGVARGVLVECQSLQPGSLGDPLTSGPVVALAWTADGDERFAPRARTSRASCWRATCRTCRTWRSARGRRRRRSPPRRTPPRTPRARALGAR